ncbi:hypothetical protein OsI_12776 [Oryza sativa Indica Group]|uniref:Uncharacterized protein n=3 Tax=Oryza TaxID=4527 RepID=Q10G63_ORYSJ|nr:hypothetical protein LOC_Os03g44040 [Oryza sativa Japonica Group]EAY91168.1 hypothetical protein OsI_12776 [Oryza sativa Indica Group]
MWRSGSASGAAQRRSVKGADDGEAKRQRLLWGGVEISLEGDDDPCDSGRWCKNELVNYRVEDEFFLKQDEEEERLGKDRENSN